MNIRLFGVVQDSIVDGPGIRYSIFVQGCLHHCPGCHNQESQSLDGGYLEDVQTIIDDISSNPLLDGITLSGGEPMLQVEPLIEICKHAKDMHLNIVIYSGYTYEEIISDPKKKELLTYGDMLVDGRYVQELRSLTLMYRGSRNQRLIDIQKSLQLNQVVEYQIDDNGQIYI